MLTSSELRRDALERLRRGELRPLKKEPEPSIQPAPGEEIPLSCGQQQIWLHSEFAPGAPIYNESITVRKTGPLDTAVLESCFNEIIRRHRIWRTAFLDSSGKVTQVVLPSMHVPLPLINLSHLPADAAAREAIRLASDDAKRPFDLSRPPLLRARLVRLAEDDHRLYLTFHHLIFDGVSIYRVFVPELAALYRAFSAGLPSPLPDLRIQYGDYAIWQQQKLANGDYAAQLSYWRKALGDDAPQLELPIENPRVAAPGWQGDMETFGMPAELSRAIRQFSASEGATLYMTLLAAFHVLLYRYSAQEQITTGAVVSTRNRPELQPLLGFLLNTVVLRSRAHSSVSFREFLNQVKEQVLEALANSDVPFDTVVRELAPRRESNRNTLFNILFSLRPSSESPQGWELSELDVHSGASGFGLFVDVIDQPSTFTGRLIYNSELFEASAIARMIYHWQRLLEAVVENPDLPIGLLPLLTANERQLLLTAAAGPSIDIPPVTISALVEAKIAQVPQRTAVTFEDHQLTFHELDCRAANFARELQAEGAKSGMLVAVCIERSVEMLVALLGILKIGAAYLPIDPSLPAERRDFLLSDAKPHFSVTSKALTIIQRHAERSGQYAGLAYVLYTSGSTGVPKGVEVPESAVVNFLRSMQREPGFSSSDILLAVTTLSFDIAVLELFLPLISGGTLVIASRQVVSDPTRLMEVMRDSGCTVMQGTPAIWRSLIDAGWRGNSHLKVLCGGESLSRGLADKLVVRSGELWNMYGPTETTIWSTVQKVEPGQGAVPIGHPINNTQVYVLDAQLQLVPTGITGELYIGGNGLARGYGDRAKLTAERFVPSPFASGERMYRTGDLARWRPSGELECLGRADNQVKVRGYRIELQEIENVLAKAPGVHGAAAKTWRDASGENGLVAYIQGSFVTSNLREYLCRRLPEYMIPSRFVELPALPLTPNGKLDRKALPDPIHEGPATPKGTAPRNDTERRLSALWTSLLKIACPGIYDDFFHLGGHSLLAAELARRIHAEFGKKLTLSTIFEHSTIEALSRLLDSENSFASAVNLLEWVSNSEQRYLHWIYGGVFFKALASHLRPAYQFHEVWLPPEIEESIRPSDRLEDVARLIIRELQNQPHNGPYQLGGWCISGILAYEVAVQLEAAGQEVGLVALLGAPNPQHYSAIPLGEKLKSKLHYHWDKITRLDLAGVFRYLLERARYHAGEHHAARSRKFAHVLLELALRYQPKPLYARVALFQAEDRPGIDYAPGWTEVVRGEFAAYEVPGDHESSLEEPNVAVLAERLRGCLR
ncbi:MAG TPA: amino acid adenylation domain-containing protein [Bryobacteraceae bacterium]|nr:amino acid adenylation domain-containing protein [Bryobacteraceae bacterium]